MVSFREYLAEAIKRFNLEINGKNFKIVKSHHVSQPRNPDSNVPRDGNFSNTKYKTMLEFIDITINDTDFAVVWTNGKYANGVYGVIKDDTITIITAIFRDPAKNKNSIFKTATNRYDIGEFKI